ncbi:MAG TPA: isoaspartyl peptidase/L-asparaginase [Vicinamibacteria bacterium]|nr:isoaspartyl peptidase/L-asparaginase [Vicinamibacteria bacterium]
MNRPALIVHGGCGTPPRGEEDARNAACERAADAGFAVLDGGGSALDAAEAAVRRLEDEPLLNAGTGSYLQADGVARLDASVMASDGRAGAVAQAPNLKNPIRLARYLLEQDAHVMLAGREALELAQRLGHETAVVATPAKIAYWQEHLRDHHSRLDYEAMGAEWKAENPRRLGTVGCVALDAQGRLAAATSTGGTGQCYPGRVGDTPIIGAGTYCTPQVGVSMTGVGERIMVLLSAKRLADLVADGRSPAEAGAAVMAELDRVNGAAGLIALAADGTLVALRNTPFMATARRH